MWMMIRNRMVPRRRLLVMATMLTTMLLLEEDEDVGDNADDNVSVDDD